MANTLYFFMTPEDEVAFMRALEPLQLVLYPEVFERDFEPFPGTHENAKLLVAEAYYLVLPNAGEVLIREVRKGPHRGLYELDEIRSPAIHFERSFMDEGELRSGGLWSELEATGDRQHLMTKPDLLRSVFDRLRTHFKKHFRHSRPTGFFVGPIAARRCHEGLVLREAGRKGETVEPFK